MNNSQRGWTFWSLLGVGALIVAGALLFMKLMPAYLDNYKLQAAMHSVAEDPRAWDWNKRQIVDEMSKTLYIDYGSDIVDLRTNLVLEKTDRQKFISIKYKVVIPLIYNVSARLDFDNRVEIAR